MDFSAWFEAYLDDRWWTFDARNNEPRIGRVLMATGRDASDVAVTTSFGQADLRYFFVVTEEEKATSTDPKLFVRRRVVASRVTTTRSSLLALRAICGSPVLVQHVGRVGQQVLAAQFLGIWL